MRSFLVAGSLVVAASPAMAGPKPLPADKHDPPVAVDFTSLSMRLGAKGSEGYQPEVQFVIMGAGSQSDRLRIDWKQGGKIVGTGTCGGRHFNEKLKSLSGSCDLDKPVKTKGPVEVDIVYTDDQEDKDYLVTTLKLDVREWKSIGTSIEYGYVPDDLLALGFVTFSTHDAYNHKPIFSFWTSAPWSSDDGQFRCSVDGNKLPDFKASSTNHTNNGGAEISHTWTRAKDQRSYAFINWGVVVDMRLGTKEELKTVGDMSKQRLAIDNPGRWECDYRIDGKVFRKFSFHVNDQGRIVPSEMQSGRWPVKTFDDTVMVDMRIPADNSHERRIRSDALKKSVGWGLPWPDHPKAKEAQAALPKSMGTPDN